MLPGPSLSTNLLRSVQKTGPRQLFFAPPRLTGLLWSTDLKKPIRAVQPINSHLLLQSDTVSVT